MSDADVEARFEARWLERQGIVLPPPPAPGPEMRNQPDPAGYDALRTADEPRRGTLRLSPSGPQQPADRPAAPAEPMGPDQGAEPVGDQLVREEVVNLLLGMRQGVGSGALNGAEPVDDAEIRQRLDPAWNDGGPVAERIAAARERAAELGLDVVFRAGRDGRVEAVQRTPDMEAPGGETGRVADALGRLFGLGFVDPVAGAATVGRRAARGGEEAATVMSSGGAGPERPRGLRDTRTAPAPPELAQPARPRAEWAAEGVEIGSAGPIFRDVDTGDWAAVVQRLRQARDGEVPEALMHPDVPQPIDVIWGRPEGDGRQGFGLAKIIQLRPTMIEDLPDILYGMRVIERTPDRIRLASQHYAAVVERTFQSERKVWLLTAFERDDALRAADGGQAAPRRRTDTAPPAQGDPNIASGATGSKGDDE